MPRRDECFRYREADSAVSAGDENSAWSGHESKRNGQEYSSAVERETQSLTSLPTAPADERSSRMVSYTISMALRLVCLYLCFVVPGWWILIPAFGVIVLPAVAVMVANVVHAPGSQQGSTIRPNLSSLPPGS